jgi:hypothetical protein
MRNLKERGKSSMKMLVLFYYIEELKKSGRISGQEENLIKTL